MIPQVADSPADSVRGCLHDRLDQRPRRDLPVRHTGPAGAGPSRRPGQHQLAEPVRPGSYGNGRPRHRPSRLTRSGVALRPVGALGRLLLVTGAVAGLLVAANPEHAGGSLSHAIWASIGFAALAAWPALAWRRGPSVPWGLQPAVSAGAVVLMLAFLVWFAAEVVTGGGQVGLAERILSLAQAVWSLTVVLSCRHPARRHARVAWSRA